MSFARSPSRPLPSALSSPLTGGGAASAPLLNGLQAYWDLSETSGNRADSGPNGFTLTDNNTVGSRSGVDAGQTAADFVAANLEYLNVASDPALQVTGDFTAAGWVFYPSGTVFPFQKDGANPGTDREYGLVVFASSVQFSVFNSVGTSLSSASVAHSVSSDWMFVVGRYEASTMKAGVSVNGGAFTDGAALADGPALVGQELTFAKRKTNYSTIGTQAFGVWNRLLTADEITWLYNSGTAARLYSDVEAYTG